ncbi:MAG: phytoene desaturase [Bacteroidia bacterium]|nr:phytoene desaturase [Bacteroidia bacterium]
MGKKVIIIGAGLGGLSTALRLSTRGYQVEILEKYHQPGGRLNQLQKDGFTFDLGPSFFSMSYEFEELFKDAGVQNPLEFNELDPLYGVYFSNRKQPFLIYKNLEKLAQEFKGIEEKMAAKVEGYLDQAGDIFHDTEFRVVKKNFASRVAYLLGLTKVPLKHAPKLFRSMWSELEKHFESEEAKVIFSLVAFFLGSTPFNTPAVYSLLNYTELKHDGYWNVKGGMYKITEEMVRLVEERGVKIHYRTEVKDFAYAKGEISAFIDQNGKQWKADLFVVNADAAAFRGKILQREKYSAPRLDKMDWTLAPFTIYLGVKGKIDNLYHHTYFLRDNFREYADEIFKTSMIPDKPYYYVNVSSRSNPECAPEGCENLFILCPVPDLRFKSDWDDREEIADNILKDLSERVGFDFAQNTLSRTILTPLEWRDKFNLYQGSGLGLAHGMNQVGGFRPANKDEVFGNLYYVGASTVPGTGLPIVVISSKLVTERITADHGIVPKRQLQLQ